MAVIEEFHCICLWRCNIQTLKTKATLYLCVSVYGGVISKPLKLRLHLICVSVYGGVISKPLKLRLHLISVYLSMEV